MTDDEFNAFIEFRKTGILDENKLKDVVRARSENPVEGEGDS
jgi:hypothetical protein